jgi:hypothetical protein
MTSRTEPGPKARGLPLDVSGERRIELTGPDSESLVAVWLTHGEQRLDPTELICRPEQMCRVRRIGRVDT